MNLNRSELFKLTGKQPVLAEYARDVPDSDIAGISTDSRKFKKGQLFVALKGGKFDGSDFVDKVFEKGAIGAIIPDKKSKIKNKIPNGKFIIQVSDTLKTLGDIALYYRGKFNIPVVAVTGSCGKTTTKEIIYALLCSGYNVLKTEGNYNNLIGLPLTIFNINDKHNAMVVEMGMSHAGEMKRLAAIAQPDIAVITNVGKAHLGFFNSLYDIAKAKAEVLETCPPPEFCVLNRDDEFFHYFSSRTKAKIITFGINKKSNFRAEKIAFDSSGKASFRLNGKIKVKIPFLGVGNIYNVLASFAVASLMGVDIKQAISALSAVKLPLGRTNFYKIRGLHILDDSYNANPSSAFDLIRTIDRISVRGKKIILLGEMLELGKYSRGEHIKLAKLISASSVDILIAVGHGTKYTAKNIFGNKKVWYFDDKSKAKKKLERLLNKGDLLAVKGSRATEMEKVIPCGLGN